MPTSCPLALGLLPTYYFNRNWKEKKKRDGIGTITEQLEEIYLLILSFSPIHVLVLRLAGTPFSIYYYVYIQLQYKSWLDTAHTGD